jgi:4-hydroxybenzoate polyprenyltransferase
MVKTPKIAAVFSVIRPVNVVITFFAVIIGGVICGTTGGLAWKVACAAVSAALINASGNVFNDILDVKTDLLNNKKRALTLGLISGREAKSLYAVLTIAGLILAGFVGFDVFAAALAASAVLFAYSAFLKKLPLAGNFCVAALTALAFMLGGIAAGNISASFIPAFYAFFINFAREIVKDMEDAEGDRISGFETFPVKFGLKAARNLSALVICALFISPFVLLIFSVYRLPFFLIVLFLVNPMFVIILRYLFIDYTKKNLVKAGAALKVNMILGLIAVYVGV